MMNHSWKSVYMWTMNHAWLLLLLLLFLLCFYFIASNEREKHIQTNSTSTSTFKCSYIFICMPRSIKKKVSWCMNCTERNGTHTVASFHMTWPLTNHSIHRQSTMFNLLDDTSNLFQFSLPFLCVWFAHSFIRPFARSLTRSFIHSSIDRLSICLPFQLTVGIFQTKAHSIICWHFVR